MKTQKTLRRKKRVRAKVKGSNKNPRISVFRSNKFLYAQLIDDTIGATLCGISEKKLAAGTTAKKPVERAKELGMLFAEKIKAKKVKKAVFDRGSYKYHGVVKAFAEGVREGGIQV